jgi:hypothetical protein
MPPGLTRRTGGRAAANDVLSWTNDIFSLRKELSRGDELMRLETENLVAFLRRAHHGPWAEAMLRAADMIAARTHVFRQTTRRLLGGPQTPAVTCCVTGLEDWIAGNLRWSQGCGRYQHID